MGTDIHYNLERWIPAGEVGNGTWEVFYSSELEHGLRPRIRVLAGPLYINRNYTLFGILCGVRSGVKPIAYPKGLPTGNDGGPYKSKAFSYNDVENDGGPYKSKVFSYNDLELEHRYHSASWLTIREIMDYDGFRTNCDLIHLVIWLMGTWLPEVLKYGKPEELRIVFCFDS